MFRRRLPGVTSVNRVELAAASALGEPPFWPTAAIVSSALLYVTLPGKFILGRSGSFYGDIRWVIAALTLVLLAALLLTLPKAPVARMLGWGAPRLRVGRRVLALALIVVLSVANAASIYLLVHVLVNGGAVVASPLLRAAVHLWCVNVLLFALWFWQLDAGGPLNRRQTDIKGRDFYFPQQSDPALFGVEWEPTFLDYLYVSYTNASAFSPTDTLPLTRWAKMLMLVQSAISLTLGLMVVARAVNILK